MCKTLYDIFYMGTAKPFSMKYERYGNRLLCGDSSLFISLTMFGFDVARSHSVVQSATLYPIYLLTSYLSLTHFLTLHLFCPMHNMLLFSYRQQACSTRALKFILNYMHARTHKQSQRWQRQERMIFMYIQSIYMNNEREIYSTEREMKRKDLFIERFVIVTKDLNCESLRVYASLSTSVKIKTK